MTIRRIGLGAVAAGLLALSAPGAATAASAPVLVGHVSDATHLAAAV